MLIIMSKINSIRRVISLLNSVKKRSFASKLVFGIFTILTVVGVCSMFTPSTNLVAGDVFPDGVLQVAGDVFPDAITAS